MQESEYAIENNDNENKVNLAENNSESTFNNNDDKNSKKESNKESEENNNKKYSVDKDSTVRLTVKHVDDVEY